MSSKFTILVGSVLGASEYVADALAQLLRDKNAEVDIQLSPDLHSINPEHTWIICTSTHGAGELPENIQPFAKQLEQANLTDVGAYVIGLGDSSYDTFCYGAIEMQARLTQAGVKLLAEPLHIDVLHHPIPEDHAVEWLQSQVDN